MAKVAQNSGCSNTFGGVEYNGVMLHGTILIEI